MVNLQFVIILAAVTLAVLHIVVAARSKVRFHEGRRPSDRVLDYGWGLKGFAVGTALVWLALFLGPAQGLQDPSTLDPSSLALLVSLVLVFLQWTLSVEVFGAEYQVTPDGIRKHSPWTRNFSSAWKDIESVSYNSSLQWTVIRTKQGKLRVHDYVRNKSSLAEALVEKVPGGRSDRVPQATAVQGGPSVYAQIAMAESTPTPAPMSKQQRKAYRRLARAGLARRDSVPVRPASYLDRGYVHALRRVFGPVQPAMLSVAAVFTFFFLLEVAVILVSPPPNVLFAPFAAICSFSTLSLPWADGSWTPVPRNASKAELTRISKRVRRAQGVLVFGMLFGLGGAYVASGKDGLLAAGGGLFLGFAAASLWLFASSRLLVCAPCGGATLYRRFQDRWLCLRCGSPMS
jgi:hypothetical protein